MHNIAMHMHVFIYVFVLVSMHIICTMLSSLCIHSTVSCITCMHFQCFKEKHCTLIVFHNRIFPKQLGGGQMHFWPPPQSVLGGGGHGPPAPPPCGGPHERTNIPYGIPENLPRSNQDGYCQWWCVIMACGA